MEQEKIEQYLEKVSQLLNENRLKCSGIHAKAGHTDHKRCYVLGLDATDEDMRTYGAQGSYFYIDEKARLHQQKFTQQEEGHDWGEDKMVTKDFFFKYIKNLPESNMANTRKIISRLEEGLKGAD